MENINSVMITGTIFNIYHRNDYVSIIVSISKPSFSEKRIRNYPNVLWYGDEANTIAEMFKEGDRVKISAVIDTNHRQKEENGDRYIPQQLILGKSIEFAKSDCEETFGIKPSIANYMPDINLISLKGRVSSMFIPNSPFPRAKVTLRIVKDNIFAFPEVYFYGKAAEYVKESIKENDVLCITGTVQTYRSVGNNGKFKYSQTIVCNEIAVQTNEPV